MPRKNGREKKSLPKIKKDIKDFLLSEEGKISKKNIAKLGISLAVLGMMLQPEISEAQHFSTCFSTGRGGHSSTHTNHANHGSGGPCGW